MPAKPLLLAIDTTGESYSLGLSQGGRMLAECSGGQPRQHLVQIFPALQLLCQQSGLALTQLQGVAVTSGPGSFTGVRTGLLIAKTLGQALSIPVYPVDTLQALAGNAVSGALVVAAMDARKGEFIWAPFRVENGLATPLRPNQLGSPAEFAQSLPPDCTLLGSACAQYVLQDRPDVRVLPADFWRVRAACVARLGLSLAAMGGATNWSRLRPDYVRPADVQVHKA